MTLREALETVVDVTPISQYIMQYATTKDYQIEEINVIIKNLIYELLAFPLNPSIDKKIVVYKAMDYDDHDFFYHFYSHVIYDNQDEPYDYSCMDWKEIIDVEILEGSIQKYGLMNIIPPIIYELTWHGFDYATAENGRKKFWKEMEESMDTFNNQKEHSYKTMEEVRQDLGIPAMPKEKIEYHQKMSKTCIAYNQQELNAVYNYTMAAKTNG